LIQSGLSWTFKPSITRAMYLGQRAASSTSTLMIEEVRCAPALNFASETSTGVYRATSGEFITAILGVLRSTISATGLAIVGTGNFTGGVAGGTFVWPKKFLPLTPSLEFSGTARCLIWTFTRMGSGFGSSVVVHERWEATGSYPVNWTAPPVASGWTPRTPLHPFLVGTTMGYKF
jgi:hypothetical protein